MTVWLVRSARQGPPSGQQRPSNFWLHSIRSLSVQTNARYARSWGERCWHGPISPAGSP